MDTQIYIISDKDSIIPDDSLYREIILKDCLSKDQFDFEDAIWMNILKNSHAYGELSAYYRIQKTADCDILGVCYDRHYFYHGEDFIKKEFLEDCLKDYDIIIPNSISPTFENNTVHFVSDFSEEILEQCRKIICELEPDYADAFDLFFSSCISLPSHMMIARKPVFDLYLGWLFPILVKVTETIDEKTLRSSNKPFCSYLSERLFRIWLLGRDYRVLEEEVRLVDSRNIEHSKALNSMKEQKARRTIQDVITIYECGETFDMADISPKNIDFEEKVPVWVFLPDDPNEDSPIFQMCVRSIERAIPAEVAKIHFITLDNISDYVEFPSWIVEKVNNDIIGNSHLAEILMANLLFRYGGLWISPSCYIHYQLDASLFDCDFFTIRNEAPFARKDVSAGNWTTDFMLSEKGNVLFRFLINAIYMYWAKERKLLDEYIVDRFISIAYHAIPQVRGMIDACPHTNPDMMKLKDLLSDRYKENQFQMIIEETGIFKIPDNISPQEETLVGNDTLYSYLLRRTR